MRTRRRGLSLPELLTAAALLLLTFGILAQVLLPTAYMASVEGARSDVQQGALIFTHTIRSGLLNAVADTVSLRSDPPTIGFATVSEDDPFDPVTASPRLAPRFTVIWLDPDRGTVMTRTWPPTPPDLTGYDFSDAARPPVLSAADLRAVTSVGPARVLVKNVESLLIEDGQGVPNGSALAYPLKLTITCAARSSRPAATEQDRERCTLSTCVRPGSARW